MIKFSGEDLLRGEGDAGSLTNNGLSVEVMDAAEWPFDPDSTRTGDSHAIFGPD